MLDALMEIDVRPVLPAISVPTLVLHTTDDAAVPIANGRWLAEQIPGARFVELPGEHAVFDHDRLLGEVESFLTGRRHAIATDRVLSTVLFTDIVRSRAGGNARRQSLESGPRSTRRRRETRDRELPRETRPVHR